MGRTSISKSKSKSKSSHVSIRGAPRFGMSATCGSRDVGGMETLVLTSLPDEVLQHILAYCPPHDVLLNVQRLSKRFNRLGSEPLLWRYHCRTDFNYWDSKHRPSLPPQTVRLHRRHHRLGHRMRHGFQLWLVAILEAPAMGLLKLGLDITRKAKNDFIYAR